MTVRAAPRLDLIVRWDAVLFWRRDKNNEQSGFAKGVMNHGVIIGVGMTG
jgi:hypothetical protein